MSILGINKHLPDYASDIKRSLNAIFEEEKVTLTQKQLYGVALAIAYSLKHEKLLNGVRATAKLYLEEIDANACKVAATMMAMTNTYYKFKEYAEETNIHLDKDDRLELSSVHNPEVPQEEMDLYCLGVSILNGCKYCIKVHIAKIKKAEISDKAIQDVAMVASLLQAALNAMEIEKMRSYDFIAREANMD